MNPTAPTAPDLSGPSGTYRSEVWNFARFWVRVLPSWAAKRVCWLLVTAYFVLRPERKRIVIQNLAPALSDPGAARGAAHRLCHNFGRKLIDLWRYENGAWLPESRWTGWERFLAARAANRGVLLVAPHLGNWEFGAPFLSQRGINLLVLTQEEPGNLTAVRQASRARWGIETLVIGADAFAFVEVIKRLQAGSIVALLVDRPWPSTAVTVELFGRPFLASIAPAELARASGCEVLPSYIVHTPDGYAGQALPAVAYDRRALGEREARRDFTQQIMSALEPHIAEHIDQWYHFVPVWNAPATK